VADSCEYGDEPTGSGAKDLVKFNVAHSFWRSKDRILQ
jgi:hypothetical protein